jgi:tetratricopeptide (TPR) repeat protein
MRRLLAAVALGGLVFALGVAEAKEKPKAKAAGSGSALTLMDVNSCLGLNNSTPAEQVAACTKVLSSGKVKKGFDGEYYAARAAAYTMMREYEKALADLNKALETRQTTEIYFQRAILYAGLGNSEPAMKDFDQVLKMKPGFAAAHLMRGTLSYRGGDYAAALADFDAAVKSSPKYAQALYARGLAKKKAGDESGGEKDLKEARGISANVEADVKKIGLTS